MTGCAAASVPPQAEIQRSALSNDEVQHALSLRIAVPAVKEEGVKEEGVKEESVKEESVKEEGVKEDVKEEDVKEEGVKEDVKEDDIKEEDVKEEDVKEERVKAEEPPLKSQQETLVEEPEVEAVLKEEAVIASKSDCCIVM